MLSPLFRSRAAAAALALFGAAALASCADRGSPLTAPDGLRLDIVPVASRDTATLTINTTLQLSAELANPQGHGFEHKKERYEWASSDDAVATVDGGGLVSAIAPGQAWVTVTHKGAADSVRITVVLPEEARALWVNRFEWGANLGPVGGTAMIVKIMDQAKQANLNVVYFQVRGQGDAYYPSELEPCAVSLCGSLGNGQPSWDPLEVAVREAHARGMELHAWINAFTGWASPNPVNPTYCALLKESKPGNPRHMLLEHPEWAMVSSANVVFTCANSQAYEYAYVSPGIPGVRTHLARVAADITRRYAVDGVHLDRIRYPSNFLSYDPISVAAFGRRAGSADPAWVAWRQEAVNQAVKETHDSINAVRPQAVLSAAVWSIYDRFKWGWPSSTGLQQYFQDTRAWTSGGYLDVAVPMTYFNINANYCSYTANNPDWACLLDDHLQGITEASGRHVYIGIGVNRSLAEVEKQILLGREKGVKGFALYSYNEMNSRDRFRLLGEGLFKQPTRVPERAY
jgi:uncharacterized lipoprotein YddW (UPF0748 family)